MHQRYTKGNIRWQNCHSLPANSDSMDQLSPRQERSRSGLVWPAVNARRQSSDAIVGNLVGVASGEMIPLVAATSSKCL